MDVTPYDVSKHTGSLFTDTMYSMYSVRSTEASRYPYGVIFGLLRIASSGLEFIRRKALRLSQAELNLVKLSSETSSIGACYV